MQIVLSDRVVSDGTTPSCAYRFPLAEYPHPLSRAEIRVVELSGSEEEEVAAVIEILREATEDAPVHAWGIRSARSVAEIRAHFDGLGWYDAPRNRYAYDCRTAPATFGCDLNALWYWPGVPPFGTAATKAVRTALNLEILKGLRVLDAPGTPGRRKKTPEEVLAELVFSGMVSPFRMGRALYFDLLDRGLASGKRELDLAPKLIDSDSRS